MRLPFALACAAFLLAGCTTGPGSSTVTVHDTSPAAPRSTPARSAQPRATTNTRSAEGIRECALSSLPKQAADTAKDIVAGGPYAYPRNDGVVYQNRNAVPRRAPAAPTASSP